MFLLHSIIIIIKIIIDTCLWFIIILSLDTVVFVHAVLMVLGSRLLLMTVIYRSEYYIILSSH